MSQIFKEVFLGITAQSSHPIKNSPSLNPYTAGFLHLMQIPSGKRKKFKGRGRVLLEG
jgi:hypothetical protein